MVMAHSRAMVKLHSALVKQPILKLKSLAERSLKCKTDEETNHQSMYIARSLSQTGIQRSRTVAIFMASEHRIVTNVTPELILFSSF